ncbi:site-specific integrase [Azospirillum sp. ST 5-10]|uniref:site-specific integrase n=1 Tax=unclassified Azospirillum TaxID=2630922 RepID=UPI003F49E56A
MSTPAHRPSIALPGLVTAAGERTTVRVLEFFAAGIRNPHTRRAYARAVGDFLAWCAAAGVPSLAAVQPLPVATGVEGLTRTHAAPTVKQRLAAVRHLFDWPVTGQVVAVNPAAPVRGPRHVVRVDKTPVLDVAEAWVLLDATDPTIPGGCRGGGWRRSAPTPWCAAARPPPASPRRPAAAASAPAASPPARPTAAGWGPPPPHAHKKGGPVGPGRQ